MSRWERICLLRQEAEEIRVPFLGQEDSLEEEVTTHSKILAWEIPWQATVHWGRREWDTTEHSHARACTHTEEGRSRLDTEVQKSEDRGSVSNTLRRHPGSEHRLWKIWTDSLMVLHCSLLPWGCRVP